VDLLGKEPNGLNTSLFSPNVQNVIQDY